MGRKAVGVHQGDRRAIVAGDTQPPGLTTESRLVQCAQNRAVGGEPLVDLDDRRVQRARLARRESEEVGALLAADREQVGESSGDEEGQLALPASRAARWSHGWSPDGVRAAEGADRAARRGRVAPPGWAPRCARSARSDHSDGGRFRRRAPRSRRSTSRRRSAAVARLAESQPVRLESSISIVRPSARKRPSRRERSRRPPSMGPPTGADRARLRRPDRAPHRSTRPWPLPGLHREGGPGNR